MTILGKADILQAADIKRELVSVPEWGGEVWVKGMTGAERDKFEGSIVEASRDGKSQSVNMTNVRAKLAAFTICDEEGKRLFTESEINALSQKSAAALQRIFEVAQKLSGIGEEAIKELTDGLDNHPFGDSASG